MTCVVSPSDRLASPKLNGCIFGGTKVAEKKQDKVIETSWKLSGLLALLETVNNSSMTGAKLCKVKLHRTISWTQNGKVRDKELRGSAKKKISREHQAYKVPEKLSFKAHSHVTKSNLHSLHLSTNR